MCQLSVKSGVVLGLFVCLVFQSGCSNLLTGDDQSGTEIYFCGAENFVAEDNDWFYDDGKGKFNAGGHQATDSVFEGKYSIKLDSLKPYGLSKRFFDVKPGEYFEASIWIKKPVGKATLIAAVSGRTNYTLNTSSINLTDDKKGWSKYALNFGVEVAADTLIIFPFAASESHYFDNIEIKRFAQRPPMEDSLKRVALNLIIADSAMELLSQYKAQALRQEVISSDLKSYVNGNIVQGTDSIPVEVRLKGDWTDHLENGKTSYRIKAEGAFNGLATFSIQHPQTRNYMHEWFMHRLCDIEGLLSTRFDFIPVQINGVNQGIYAIEEHFDKQLLESRNRREGPIIKMDETGFWALLASGQKDSLKGSYPYFESSIITCFKDGRTEKNQTLSDQFENAASLLSLYKNLYAEPELLFDMEKTAKYYALMELGNVHHALAWHNRRFYYNPVSAQLEIIGFDMIPAVYPFSRLLAFRKFNTMGEAQEDENAIDHFLFLNKEFREHYTRYVTLFSSERYLDSMFKVLEPEILECEKLLSSEFSGYRFDTGFYYEKAEYMRKDLKGLEASWNKYMKANPAPKILPPNYPAPENNFFLKEISINAYRSPMDSTGFKLGLENFHPADVTVVAYSTKNGEDSVFLLDQPLKLRRYDGFDRADYAEINLPKKPNKIHFTVANSPGVLQTKKVFNWKRPEPTHPRIELEKKFKTLSPLYHIERDTLRIRKGDYVLDELILVPKKYVVVVEAGTTIDLINGAGIITNNSTYIGDREGTQVIIKSSDRTSQGLVILQADTVRIENAQFYNLNALDYKGWTLTGAVTIYEGSISINNVEIGFNQCEDALNIIRGKFDIMNLTIHDTYSDGFDADFCSGVIAESDFQNTGNDCIDFSGSQVTILGIDIRNSGDKGISSGERSTLIATNIDIDGALTAFASKDGSVLTVNQSSAKNCEVGVALYRKKPEYVFSKMVVENSTFSDIKTYALIERGAVLTFDKVNYFGYTIFDIDAMYARFEK